MKIILFLHFCHLGEKLSLKKKVLRTVLTIVTAHIFCACQSSRAQRERNAQHAGLADWFCLRQVWEVLVISGGKDASFFNR